MWHIQRSASTATAASAAMRRTLACAQHTAAAVSNAATTLTQHYQRTNRLTSYSAASPSLFYRGIAGPSAAASAGATNKGARSKRATADEDAASNESTVVVPDTAAVTAAKKAAREAKKAKKAGVVAETKHSATEARRIKKESQREASMRAEQKFKTSVIEKEVPLMDLTGIKPGQNKVSNRTAVLYADRSVPQSLRLILTLAVVYLFTVR